MTSAATRTDGVAAKATSGSRFNCLETVARRTVPVFSRVCQSLKIAPRFRHIGQVSVSSCNNFRAAWHGASIDPRNGFRFKGFMCNLFRILESAFLRSWIFYSTPERLAGGCCRLPNA
jgi:hypothetical protein